MLRRGAEKFAPEGANRKLLTRLTRCRLRPMRCICRLRAESLDLIVTAFGFSNLANYEAGLKEFHRVLKPGGPVGNS